MQIKKKILLTHLIQSFFFPNSLEGRELTLHDAINIYVYNTEYVKTKRLALENTLMEYDNFKKSLLPALSLNITPIYFNHSMRLLQNYNTGEYSNVEEYSNTTSGGISITQKIIATGGILTLGSSLDILHEFTTDNSSFSSIPMCLSYSQSLFGGRKSLTFERAISQFKKDMAMKEFCTSVSTEQQKILTLYLDAYSNKVDIDFYLKTVNMGDSLLMLAKLRKEKGKITEYEYNQVEIQQIDNKIALNKSLYDYTCSMRLLENELSFREFELEQLSVTNFPAFIDKEIVFSLISKNNPEYQSLEMKRLNAEYVLHQTKMSTRFNANISLSYGLNQYAKIFKDAYHRPNQRQTVSVTFCVPIFQWGINRNKLKIAKNEYEMVLLEQKYTLDHFKEEINRNVFDYNMSRELMDMAGKKYELSARQYSFAAMRFKVGKMATIELTNANREYLQAKQNYILVLRELFINYYKIRHVSLYDFMENKDIMELICESITA